MGDKKLADLTCICRNCGELFYVRFDDEYSPRLNTEEIVGIDIRGCESGGIYAMQVTCPHCKHIHSM